MMCAHCGKPAHRQLERVDNPFFMGSESSRPTDGDKYTWRYRGNKTIIRTQWHRPDGLRPWPVCVYVWDGETWDLKYHPFCSLTCGFAYGKGAVRKSLRAAARTVPR